MNMIQKTRLKTAEVYYDSETDSLTARFNNKNTSHSVDLNDVLIIDLSESNKIAGIEILGLSEFYDFDRKELEKITQLTLKVTYNPATYEMFTTALIEFKDGSKVKHHKQILMQPFKVEKLSLS